MVPVVSINENVEVEQVTSSTRKEKVTKVAEVRCYALNIRKGPGTNYNVKKNTKKKVMMKFYF